jgi:hypothetical protein
MFKRLALFLPFLVTAGSIRAADQTVVGAGNALAEQIASGSLLVQSAKQALSATPVGSRTATFDLLHLTQSPIRPLVLLIASASTTPRRTRLSRAC